MKRTAGILVTLMVGVVAAQLFADVSIENRGSMARIMAARTGTAQGEIANH